ncbi:GNAT family N-acetyltransferase [Streptomyces sp. NPDC012637]|uniref:GNAT family N-acetyltransferase n=1 Tax=Streptomyces sp. NPDC012637 TaxID=3364842 RepID=UPI0036E57318
MITLRELTLDDALAVQRIYSGASIRFTHTRPYSAVQARERVDRALTAAREEPRSRWDFGILHAQDLVGLVSLRVPQRGIGTLSYILREDTWGNGYATEAVTQIVAFAFTAAGLERLEAKHHPHNPASGRVLSKAGFARSGTVDLPGKYRVIVPYPVYEICA